MSKTPYDKEDEKDESALNLHVRVAASGLSLTGRRPHCRPINTSSTYPPIIPRVVNNKSEHPTFKILMRFPIDIDGEMGFVFSELEMTKAADEFRVGEKMKNEGKVKDNKIWQQKGIKEPMEDKTRTVMGEKILETGAVNGNPNENMTSVSVAHDLGDLNVTSPAEMDPEENLGEVGIISQPDLINSVDMIQHREGK
ncbi:hypothetical protein ACLOJK_005963 [Asimina triloba]